MTESNDERVYQLFLELCDVSVSERQARLERETPKLATAVRELIQADSEPSLLEGEIPATAPVEIPGVELESIIGHGGMGVVYAAQQLNPKRRVAVKVMRSMLSEPAARRRFEHEVELLAGLQHVGIAQVYEAGEYEAAGGARPYFVMEFVDGRPLTDHARGNSTEQKVRLLIAVCEAVQHAHEHAVIHRDLKPANILVTSTGQPKVLDFGIARDLAAGVDATALTQAGSWLGTLSYMSPERFAGGNAKLDTRTDVYALGVIAAELLQERHPYADRMDSAAELIAAVTSGQALAFDSGLDMDLLTILRKATDSDSTGRYGSALELGLDLQRFLDKEPVSARPPSRTYLARKFVRRNPRLVASASIAVLAIVVGSVGVGLMAKRAHDGERRAVDAKLESDRRFEVADSVARFWGDVVIEEANPGKGRDESFTLRQALEAATESLDGRYPEDPEIEATLRASLGRNLMMLGNLELARSQSESARALYEKLCDPSDPRLLEVRSTWASIVRGFGEFELAEKETVELIAIYDREHPNHKTRLTLRGDLAYLHAIRGRNDEALAQWREAYELSLSRNGERHPTTLATLCDVATGLIQTGEPTEAVKIYEALLPRMHDELEPDDSLKLTAKLSYAMALSGLGEFERAELLLDEALADSHRIRGVGHPESIRIQCHLSTIYELTKRPKENHAAIVLCWDLAREYLPVEHPLRMGIVTHMLTDVCDSAEVRMEGSDEVVAEYLGRIVSVDGEKCRDHYTSLTWVIRKNVSHGRFEAALELSSRAVELFAADETGIVNQSEQLALLRERSTIYRMLERYPEAVTAARAMQDSARVARSETYIGIADFELGSALLTSGDPDECEKWLLAAYENFKKRNDHERLRLAIGALLRLSKRLGDDERTKRYRSWQAELKTSS